MRRKNRPAPHRGVVTSLLLGGAALVAIDIGWRTFRRSQLFVPERRPLVSWNPEDYGVPAGRTEVLAMETDDGELLYGWYCRAERPVASAVFCHGNTGNLSNTAHVMAHLLDAGLNVLTFDYRGFGRSTGWPTPSGLLRDAIAVARVHERIRPPELPTILYGFSLGGAIAAQIIERHPFDGLILQSTFTSLPDIARVAFPRLPLHLVSGRFFDTRDVVRRLTIPVLTIHGTSDEVCPAWMAEELHRSSSTSSKSLLLVEGGLHKDLFTRDDVGNLVRSIHEFAAGLNAAQHPDRGPQRSALERTWEWALRSLRRFRRRHLAQQLL